MVLVLSRKKGKKIRIGDNVEIMVLEIRGDKVKLGIVANGVPVHREEVYRRIQKELTDAVCVLPPEEVQPGEPGSGRQGEHTD